MKRIQIRKPDIRGFFVKVRNLKKEDIKRHFEQKRERRRKILEERQNSAFSKKMRPVYKWMNRLSLPLHYLLACVINFLIELISRHSLFQAWDYLVETPLVFLYNSFLDIRYIDACLSGAAPGFCQNPDQCVLGVPGDLQRISFAEAGNSF